MYPRRRVTRPEVRDGWIPTGPHIKWIGSPPLLGGWLPGGGSYRANAGMGLVGIGLFLVSAAVGRVIWA